MTERIPVEKLWDDEDLDVPNGYVAPMHENDSPKSLWKLSYCHQLIPRWVQEDLYAKVDEAINEIDLGETGK